MSDSHALFGDFGVIWRKIAKVQKLKNLGIIGLLRHSVGNPRRGVDLCQGVGYLSMARPRCQSGTPRVHQGVAKLRHGESLRRSVAVLRRGINIIHNEQFLDCCSESLVFVHR